MVLPGNLGDSLIRWHDKTCFQRQTRYYISRERECFENVPEILGSKSFSRSLKRTYSIGSRGAPRAGIESLQTDTIIEVHADKRAAAGTEGSHALVQPLQHCLNDRHKPWVGRERKIENKKSNFRLQIMPYIVDPRKCDVLRTRARSTFEIRGSTT